jgi:hypothetical protein
MLPEIMTTPEQNDQNYSECICDSCPSYPGGGDPKLYCARGKSDRKIDMEGCICPAGCPVYAKYKLRDMYYCVYGKAK